MSETLRDLLEMTSHGVLPAAPGVAQAHRLMRMHRSCGTDHCRRKDQAMRVLVAAGRIVPDSARMR
ncbi:hypothetical protein [Nocardia jiangsuensis]|uniref:Zinc finger protein n=1 Tax=Nocardia jiangsuensis TaxID=1691563 RepID=A0ABV8DVY6_9NOCA